MPISSKRSDFLESELAQEIRQKLQLMVASSQYDTSPSYTSNAQYLDKQIPFVDKHIGYLNSHPKLDSEMYLANLRLITRIR